MVHPHMQPNSGMTGVAPPGVRPRASLAQRGRQRASAMLGAVERDVSPMARWAVGLAIFLSVSRLHQFIRPLGIIKAPFLLSIVATVLLLTQTPIWKPGQLFGHWIWKCLLILIVFALLSVPMGIFPGHAFDFIKDAFSRAIWIAILVYAVARTRKGARFIGLTLGLAGFTAAVLALRLGRHDSEGRLSGGYTYDSNDLALIACVTLPFVYWYAVEKKNKYRWFVAATAIPLLSVIIKSGSRGGFLGLAAIVLGTLVLGIHNVSPRLRKISILLVVCSLASIPLLPADYRARIVSIADTDEDYNVTSKTGRLEVWKRGMQYAKDYPIAGVGIDNFPTAEGRSDIAVERHRAGRGMKWSAAHNSYLQVIAELGFIAGTVFPIMIFGTIFQLLIKLGSRTRKEGPGADLLGPLLGVSLLSYSVAGFFLSFAYYDIVYVMLALASAILVRAKRPIVPAAPAAPQVPVRGRRSAVAPGRRR